MPKLTTKKINKIMRTPKVSVKPVGQLVSDEYRPYTDMPTSSTGLSAGADDPSIGIFSPFDDDFGAGSFSFVTKAASNNAKLESILNMDNLSSFNEIKEKM